jgi:hypothetical protein
MLRQATVHDDMERVTLAVSGDETMTSSVAALLAHRQSGEPEISSGKHGARARHAATPRGNGQR